MKFEKYKFRKYKPEYKKLFQKEKAKLKKLFPDSKIEHIGSTAVVGLGGKGIIDINLEINKNKIKDAIELLKNNDYKLFYKIPKNKEKTSFEKDYLSLGKIKRVHVHLIKLNSHTGEKMSKI